MEVSFSKEIESLRLGAGQTFHGEGILAITKALAAIGRGLCRRLPGRAGVAPAGRDGAGQALHGRAGRARRSLRQRGLGGRDAGRLDPLPAARRGDLEIHRRHQRGLGRAVEPFVARRQGRRADRGGRGLRRRRIGDPGAHPRLCAEVHACACSIPRPDLGVMVRMVEEGFRLSEASNMPCILELRIRACHVRGSFEAKDNLPPRGLDPGADGKPGRLRLHAARASAGDLPP